MPPAATRPIVILGPTAGGKSELAVEIADALPGGGEIISADSMQVYRHMDAGTAKPSHALRQRTAHHLIDIIEPTQRFTVHDWLARAEAAISDITARGRTPILVGGTNLYLKALLEGMFEGPGIDEPFRESLADVPGPKLHERLTEVDPVAAKRIAPADRKRLTRALEVHHLTGRPISELQQQWRDETRTATYRHDPVLLGLDWPTDAINRRINLRVKQMFFPPQDADTPESLPDEAHRLDAAGLLGPQAREALGYKQVLTLPPDEALEQTKIQTRRFAKQQRTWLKRFRGIRWLAAAEASPTDLAHQALKLIAAPDAHPNQ